MLDVWRYIVAMLMILISLVTGGIFSVFRSGESSNGHKAKASEGWEHEVCRAIGCPNSSELTCGTASGTMEVVVMILDMRWVIYEEEYTITCTQGRV